jgi:hypothetical protein
MLERVWMGFDKESWIEAGNRKKAAASKVQKSFKHERRSSIVAVAHLRRRSRNMTGLTCMRTHAPSMKLPSFPAKSLIKDLVVK